MVIAPRIIILIAFFLSTFAFCQQGKTAIPKETNKISSVTRTFIDNSEKTRINKDWSLSAEFKSGLGEKATFFPVQLINIDTKSTVNAIELEMFTISGAAPFRPGTIEQSSVWIDYDEIDSFIAFIENNIIPNLDLKYKDKSSEFIFQAKELTLKFLIHEKRQRLTIEINNSNAQPFWTETQVDNFPKLLPMLKKVNNKELKFE